MASSSELLRLLIRADTAGAVQEINKLGQTADRELGRTEDKAAKTALQMQKMGTGMLLAGGAAAVGLAKTASAASDLGEAVNVTAITFDEAAGEIGEFAENAEAIGLSERAARQATAQFGGLLKNVGFASDETVRWSQDLTTLASDLGSAFNREPADAALALGAALRGESEPIRAFNVMLDDAAVRAKAVELGLASSAAEVDNYGKTQGRLALIMEQTTDAQGDFARTSDGLANQQRILNAEWENMQAAIGQAVLPVMKTLVSTAGDVVGGFTDVNEATGGLLGKASLLGAGLLLLGGTVLTVAGKLLEMKQTADKVGESLSGKLTPKVAAAGTALTIGVGILAAYADHQRKAKERVDALADSINELGRAASVDALIEDFLGGGRFGELLDEAGMSARDLSDALAGGETTLGPFLQRLEEVGDITATDALRLREMAASLEKAQTQADRTAEAQQELGTATDDAADSTGGLTEEVATAEDRLGDYLDAIDEVVDKWTSWSQAGDDLEGAFLDVADTIVDNTEKMAKLREEGASGLEIAREQERADIDRRDALRDLIAEIGNTIQVQAEQGASEEELQATIDGSKQKLREMATQYGLTEDEVRILEAAINDIPIQTTAVISADTTEFEAGIRRAQTLLATLPFVNGVIMPRPVVSAGRAELRMHNGGIVPGQPGQEVPVVLEAGEQVISRAATESSAGRPVIVNVNGWNRPMSEAMDEAMWLAKTSGR